MNEKKLLKWLKHKSTESRKIWCNDCEFLNDCRIEEGETRKDILCAQDVVEKTLNRVNDHIKEGIDN